MLSSNGYVRLLLPAMLCLGACSAHDVRSDDDRTTAIRADEHGVAAQIEAGQQTRRIDELTSDHAELLHRRNGIESEPERHQPDVVADPGR